MTQNAEELTPEALLSNKYAERIALIEKANSRLDMNLHSLAFVLLAVSGYIVTMMQLSGERGERVSTLFFISLLATLFLFFYAVFRWTQNVYKRALRIEQLKTALSEKYPEESTAFHQRMTRLEAEAAQEHRRKALEELEANS